MPVRNIGLLPEIFRTNPNEKFINATIEQLTNEPNLKRVDGYIGKKFTIVNKPGDNYIQESTTDRDKYQLEPAVVVPDADGKPQFTGHYIDLLNKLRFYGADTTDQTRLFSNDYYSYDSQIEYDKFVNFSQYYWVPSGPTAVAISSDTLPANTTTTVTRTGSSTTVAAGVGDYQFDSVPNQINPLIILSRSGTYNFSVNQDGNPFWIQTEPGISGTQSSQPNFSTREIHGVVNNGEDNGTVTFNVPDANAQSFYTDMTDGADVNFAVSGITYADLQGILYTDFIAAHGGIDGNVDIDGKTLIFVDNSVDIADWTGIGADTTAETADDTVILADNDGLVTVADRTSQWKITLVPSGGDFIITLSLFAPLVTNIKHKILEGVQFNDRSFYRDGSSTIQLVPLITALQDTFYYQDGNDANLVGIIKIVDAGETFVIDVAEDILGMASYTSPNSIKFTNGLKIRFNEFASPAATYADKEFYVEGIGDAITLTPVDSLLTPEDYVVNALEPFDSVGFDTTDYDGGISSPTIKDYITMNRASIDNNPWARSNRWFHIDVLRQAASAGDFELTLEADSRANRPIIEFNANLKLFNFGLVGVDPIDLQDTTETDALSNIHGSLVPLTIDSIEVKEGMRVVFLGDLDAVVRKTIYTVGFIDADNDAAKEINLVADPVTLEEGNNFLVSNGLTWSGNTLYLQNGVLVSSQAKTKINQQPLFDVFDINGNKLSDTSTYVNSSFTGTKLFSYAVGTGGNDTVLGFPLTYRNFQSVGDIVFENNFDADTFSFTTDDITSLSKINLGLLHKTTSLTTHTRHNTWRPAAEPSNQSQLFTYDNNGTAFYRIDVDPVPEAVTKHYHVCVDSVALTRDQFQFSTVNDVKYIEILTDITDAVKIDILIYSIETSSLAVGYEVPINLENNAQNNSFSDLTLGQIRNHIGTAFTSSNRVTGVFPGNSDLRDLPFTLEAGGDILQHSAGLPYADLFLLDKTSNFIDSVQHAQAEYARFKYKFIDLSTRLDIDVLDTITATDQIIAFINDVKTSDFPWFASDMVPYGTDTTETSYTVTQTVNRTFELVSLYDNTTVSNKAALVYVNDVQIVSNIDFTYDSLTPYITILDTYPLIIGDVVKLVEYSNTDGNWIPETPSKMGMYPAFAPARITDDAFVTNPDVIRGHDGSITPVYGDFRDDLLLELEKRIYNNIKTPFDENRLSINSIKPGRFRTTEYTLEEFNNTLARYFYKFVGENKLDYRNDDGFDAADSFTYNYRKFGNKIDDEVLQGNWKAVYNYFYDTIHPNTRPWEMLGFSARPLWWVDTYGPAPYTSGNLVLWQDLEAGRIVGGTRAGIDLTYARPGLLDIIPVDAFGTLLSPNQFLVNGSAVQYANESYIAGEEGPVETAWRNSSQFPYAMQIILALLKPAEYFGLFADLQDYNYNAELNQFLFEPTNQRLTQTDIMLNGEVTNNVRERAASYMNWIADFIRSDNISPTSYLGNILNKFTINLAYKVAGFTDKKLLKVIAEQSSPSSTAASVIIPDEDFHVNLNTTAPLIRVSYSSVIVEKTQTGFRVDGYNLGNPHFTILPSIENTNTGTLKVLDETVTLFKSFSSQPVSIPYGFEFTSKEALIDFLVGYQRFLERQGFLFNVYDKLVAEVKNWLMSAKEFLYWSQQGWDVGNVIVLNPVGDKIHMNTPGAVVGEIKQQSPHAIADQNFSPIPDNNFTVKRIDNEFQLEVLDGRAIGFLEVTLVQFEHVLVFNNITVFNDVIYQAELGNRQLRLKLVGQVSNNWNGALAPAGYIYNDDNIPAWQQQKDYRRGDIVSYKSNFFVANSNLAGVNEFDYSSWSVDDFGKFNDGLIPNFSNLARVPEDFYEINNVNLESQTDLFGKGLIGFRRREYFDQLGLDDTSQVKFYQGMLQKKGTVDAANAMTRARLRNDDSDISLSEEWAIRVGAYGATDSTAFIETQLDEGTITSNPVLLAFKNSGDMPTVDAENVYPGDIFNTTKTYDKDLFLTQSSALGLDFTVKTAGLPILTDAEYKLFSWDDFDSLNAVINTAGVGQLIWVAKETNNDWNIYRISQTDAEIRTVALTGTTYEIDTNVFHNLVVGDRILVRGIDTLVDRWYVVSSIKDLNTFYVETTVDATDFAEIDTTSVAGQLYKLVSNRFATNNEFIAGASIAITDSEKLYIDMADADENWNVYEKTSPWLYNSRSVAQVPQASMNFGNSVAMSADSLLVFAGAPGANSGVGSLNIATKNNLGLYNTTVTLTPTPTTVVGFGTSVDTDDGTHIAAGAPGSGPAGSEGTGYVYVYTASSSSNGFTLSQILVPPTLPAGNAFGTVVELSDDGLWLYATSPAINQVNAYNLVNTTARTEDWTTSTPSATPTFTPGFTIPNINALTITDERGRTYIPEVDYTITAPSSLLSTADSGIITADAARTASNALILGNTYEIRVPGTGDWTTAGAADSNIGTVFVANSSSNGQSDGEAADASLAQTTDVSSTSLITFTAPFVYGTAPDLTLTFAINPQYYVHVADLAVPALTDDTIRSSLSTNSTGSQLMIGVIGGNEGRTADEDLVVPDAASNALTIGNVYTIVIPGTGDWTTVGAVDNVEGTVFTATGTTNGGTVASNALIIGARYEIVTLGSGNWGLVGAGITADAVTAERLTGSDTITADAEPQVGTIFIATATTNGAGDGVVVDGTARIPGNTVFADDTGLRADNDMATIRGEGQVHIFDRMVEKFIALAGQTTYRVAQNFNTENVRVTSSGVELTQHIDYSMDIGEGDIILTTPSAAGEIVQIETNDFQLIETVTSPAATEPESNNYGWAVDICPLSCVLLVGMPGYDSTAELDHDDGIVYNYVNHAQRFGTITSTVQNPTVTAGDSIRLDDVTIFFSGTTLGSVVNDINNALIPGVTADEADGYLVINSDSRIDFDKLAILPGRTAGTNTGFADLGFDLYPLATTITGPYALPNERFGEAVQIGDDNNTIIVGSSTASSFITTTIDATDTETTFDSSSTTFGHLAQASGAVSVYEYISVVDETITNMGEYIFAQQLIGDDLSAGDLFGTSIALNGNLIVAGAPGDTSNGIATGTIYNFTNDDRKKAWQVIRTQGPQVDVDSINKVYLYDNTTKLITNNLDYIDPVKTKVLGQAEHELDFLTSFDPAKYNFSVDPDKANDKINWSSTQIGRLWWDLSTVRYLNYEQIDAKYKFQNWGVYFPGSSIDVYEWVETDVLPSAYVAAGYDGVPKDIDDSLYTQISFIDTQTGLSNISYFYWVKDKTEVDKIAAPFRSITASQVAEMIDNPKGTGIAYAEIIDPSSIGLVNVTSKLSDDDIILHVDYDVIPNDSVIHSEYALIQEGGSTTPPDKIINKLIDSLAGIDSRSLTVPDPDLPLSSRLGLDIRPRQSMFINRPAAVEALVLSVNTLLAQFRIVDIRTMPSMYSAEAIPTVLSGEYNESVATIEALQLIDVGAKPTGYKALVLVDSSTSNFWVIYELQADDTWVASRVQAYDTTRYWSAVDWYATGFDATTTVDITLQTRVELHTLQTIVPGSIIKVLDNGNGQFELLQENDGNFTVVGVEASTVEISSDLYNPDNGAGFDTIGWDLGLFDSSPQEETRRIVGAVFNEILIDELAGSRNALFFAMIRHILAEQSYVDWMFKTSFVSVKQEFDGLQQFPIFQRTTQTFLEDYINEIKPYRTKIREFLLDQRIMDTWDGDVTDFDQPAYYDFGLSRFRGPSGEQATDAALLASAPEYDQWNSNHTYYVGSISVEDGGTGYIDAVPPAITISGGGGTGATAVATVELGIITAITVTNPGTGYTTTPTVSFVTGAGTPAAAYAHLANDEVRKLKVTMKFDRVTYDTTVIDWAPSTAYTIGQVLAQGGNAWSVTSNFTSGVAFTSNNLALVPLETFDNANDRTWAAYQPTPGMIDRDLEKLYTGIAYPGLQIVGPIFPGTGDFEDTRDGGTLATNFDGLRPGEEDIDGGAFVGVNNVYGPEELLPGRVFETMDIQVYAVTDQGTIGAPGPWTTAGVCYRQFQNVGGEYEYLRISDTGSARTSADLDITDTFIQFVDSSGLAVPGVTTSVPGFTYSFTDTVTFDATGVDATVELAAGVKLQFVEGGIITYGVVVSSSYDTVDTTVIMSMENGDVLTVGVTTFNIVISVIPGIVFMNGERIAYYGMGVTAADHPHFPSMTANSVWQLRRGTQGTSIPATTVSGERATDGTSATQQVITASTPPRIDSVIEPWKTFGHTVNIWSELPTANGSDDARVGATGLVLQPTDPAVTQIVFQVQEVSPGVYDWIRIIAYTDIEWHDRDPFLVNVTDAGPLDTAVAAPARAITSQAVFLQASPGYVPDDP